LIANLLMLLCIGQRPNWWCWNSPCSDGRDPAVQLRGWWWSTMWSRVKLYQSIYDVWVSSSCVPCWWQMLEPSLSAEINAFNEAIQYWKPWLGS